MRFVLCAVLASIAGAAVGVAAVAGAIELEIAGPLDEPRFKMAYPPQPIPIKHGL